MHSLRHYYASRLIRSGCSVKSVQARLGHATAAETLDTYSHLWPDDEDQTRAAVDRRARRGLGESRPNLSRTCGGLGRRFGRMSPGQRGSDDEWACKRDSVRRLVAPGWPSISAAYPGVALAGGRVTRAPCSALLPVGLIKPPGSPRTLVRSCRTVSPLPVTSGRPAVHRRSVLCDTVRQVAPTWLSPAPCPVEPRLSSTRSMPSRGHPAHSSSPPVYERRVYS